MFCFRLLLLLEQKSIAWAAASVISCGIVYVVENITIKTRILILFDIFRHCGKYSFMILELHFY